MQTVEFLRFVLPTEGVYCAVVIGPKGFAKQRFFTSVEKLARYTLARSRAGENVYYACAAYKDDTSRTQANVASLKSFFLDLDCGPEKEFATQRDAVLAIVEMCKATKLPKPTVVSSGNGLHVYWTLEEAVSLAQWQPLALKLKTAAPGADPAVTADAARVLRAPGTMNPRGGGEVKVLAVSPPVSIQRMRQALGATGPAVEVAPKSDKRARLDAALEAVSELPPANAALVTENCANVKWASTHQDQVPEPLWYALMGVAAYCLNPEQVAVEWSDQYPAFSEDETLAKLAQWKATATGPATCALFAQHNPKGCEKCPFAEKITTPVQLGVRFQQVSAPVSAPDKTAATVPVPKGFKRVADGFVAIVDKVEVRVCDFDIYPVSYGFDEVLGYEVALYRWYRRHIGWQDLRLRQALLIPGPSKDFMSAVADQGIMLNTTEQVDRFKIMLRGYLNELRHLQTMTNLYATMGWKEDYTHFVLGDKIFRKDDKGAIEVVEATFGGFHASAAEDMFASKGSPEAFAKLSLTLDKAKLPIHNWMFMVGLSSVLYEWSGIDGAVINLYGPTGSGKTLAQMCQQAIWGNPKKLHFSSRTTSNALYQRMGLLCNLPLTMDEATMMSPKELCDFVYSVTQGRDKARLTRTAEARDAKTWSMPLTTSSNKAFGTMLASAGMEADAQLARLIDLSMTTNPLFEDGTETGAKLYKFVCNCYGHVGPAFIEYILTVGPDAVMAMMDEHRRVFAKQYDVRFAGKERFWAQVIISADFCGMIACEQGWLLCDYRKSTVAVLEALGTYREAVNEQTVDAFDLLGEYLNEHMHETLTVIHTLGSRPVPDINQMPRGAVHVRYDIKRDAPQKAFNKGTLCVDRTHLRVWLTLRGFDYKLWKKEIQDSGVTRNAPHEKRVAMGRFTPLKLPQQMVLGFNLEHPRLAYLLRGAEDKAMDDTMQIFLGDKADAR
jgi:hypothetical protein